MSRDDVLRMAQEAGLVWDVCRGGFFVKDPNLSGEQVLMRLAALLTADARASRIAAQTENEALKARLAASGVAERRAVHAAVMAEREACAKLCDGLSETLLKRSLRKQHHHGAGLGSSMCADAIRARGAA